MRAAIIISAFVAAVIASPSVAWAGPWTKSYGDYYVKLGQSLYLADGFVDTGGEFQRGAKYQGHTTSLYAEVGLARRLQLNAYLPFTVAINRFPDDWQYLRGGLADSKLGLQWSPIRSATFAIRADTSIPLYDVGDYDGPFEERIPLLGDGQLDQTLAASYGASWSAIQSYASAEFGWLHRTEWFVGKGPAAERSYNDGLVWGAQFGHTFFHRAVLAISGNGVIPLGNNRFTKGYASMGPTVYVPIVKPLAIEGGVFWTPWARHSARGVSYSLGVSIND